MGRALGSCEARSRRELGRPAISGMALRLPSRRWRCRCTSLTRSNAEIARNPSGWPFGPVPCGFRRRGGICCVGAPRRCTPASPASRRLASAPAPLGTRPTVLSPRAASWPPGSWTTFWHNSGSGDAIQYDSSGTDSRNGNNTLRLHVSPGGGSTFALSDPIDALPDTDYRISTRMRYNLTSEGDSVYFSVIQLDDSGSSVGFDEIIGLRGDNHWWWQPWQQIIHTASDAVALRIRFGLMADSESYLDVDAVR